MTALIEVNEQYTQEFQKIIKTIPKSAIKLTVIKRNLNEELSKRIAEINNGDIKTKPISELSSIRERYV